MFSTVRAGLCILVQIHLSLFSPSCQTQRNQRSLTAPYSHVENPGHSYPCWETHQQGKLLFYLSPRHSLGKWSDTPTWPLVSSSLFFPWSSSVWLLPLFRWKGLGLVLWHHFLGFETQGKDGIFHWGKMTGHKAMCCHLMPSDNCLPDALKSPAFSYFCYEKERIISVMSLNPWNQECAIS